MKELSEAIKDKTNQDLLNLIQKWGEQPEETDPDYLSYLINELNKRKLNDREQKDADEIILLLSKTGSTDMNAIEYAEISEMDALIVKTRRKKPVSYSLLKKWLYIFGIVVIIIGFFMLVADNEGERSFVKILSVIPSIGLGLILIALSVIIELLIEIEKNTRKNK